MAVSAEASNSSSPYDYNATHIYECHNISYLKIYSEEIPCIVFLVGMPLNMWLLILLVKSLWVGMVTSDILSLNATFIQNLYCLANPLVAIGLHFQNVTILMISLFLSGLMMIGWSLFQSSTCVQRYLAVVHPIVFLKFRAKKYRKYRVICSVVIWLLALIYCFIIVSSKSAFPVEVFIVPYSVMVVLNTFCSFSIMRALNRPAPGHSSREGMHKLNRQAFMMVLITQLLVTMNCLPYICTGILKTWGLPYEKVCLGFFISYGFMNITVIFQPLLSLSQMGKLSKCAPA